MIRMIMLLIMQKNLHMMNLGMMKVIELYYFNQNVIER